MLYFHVQFSLDLLLSDSIYNFYFYFKTESQRILNKISRFKNMRKYATYMMHQHLYILYFMQCKWKLSNNKIHTATSVALIMCFIIDVMTIIRIIGIVIIIIIIINIVIVINIIVSNIIISIIIVINIIVINIIIINIIINIILINDIMNTYIYFIDKSIDIINIFLWCIFTIRNIWNIIYSIYIILYYILYIIYYYRYKNE